MSNVKRDNWSKIKIFFHTPCIRSPRYGGWVGHRQNISIPFGTRMLPGYPKVKKVDDTFSRFDRILTCDRQTDGQ